MKNGYCEKCDNVVDYSISEVLIEASVKGKKISFVGLEGHCSICGEVVASNYIVDENLNRLDSQFRKEEGIITANEINEILLKYNIGKKPLSKLLGWGEVTLVRYLNGDMPTKIYSDVLYKIYNDENYMDEILEANKNLITNVAYEKVKQAIKNIRNEIVVEKEIDLIAKYIIIKGVEVTQLSLQKLLYYAQGFYRAFTGKYMFEDDCEAWVHGPVFSNIYQKYKKFGSSNIEIEEDNELEDMISTDKKELLDIIIKYFGNYNGRALELMSHFEKPWQKARKGLLPNENSNTVINKNDMTEYFTDIINKYEMLSIFDIKNYSEDQFKKAINY